MHMRIYEGLTRGKISAGSGMYAGHPSPASRRAVDQRSWLQARKPSRRQAMISDSARACYFAERKRSAAPGDGLWETEGLYPASAAPPSFGSWLASFICQTISVLH